MPGGLLADGGGLVFAVSPREQQAGRGTGWPDYHPPLGTPVVGPGRRVLHELEAQYVREEADGRVVFPDHDGDEAEMHDASIPDRPGFRSEDAAGTWFCRWRVPGYFEARSVGARKQVRLGHEAEARDR